MSSTSPSSPGKASLTNWWKQIKHDVPNPNLLNDTATTTNPTVSSSSLNNNSDSSNTTSNSALLSPSRPFLGLKSKSSNSVPGKNPFAVTLDNSSQEKLKQHRDSFLNKKNLDFFGDSEVFGVSLRDSIKIAEGKICISSDNGLVTYGKIPRVIAVCGIYLKKNGLDTEGIFRVAGSSRRIKQLQLIFSSPPDYGTKIDWDGYTVHDAASLFRRFLASLPEPLIPFSFYQEFRRPLINRPIITKYLNDRKTKYLKKQAAAIYAPMKMEQATNSTTAATTTTTTTSNNTNTTDTTPIIITKDSSSIDKKLEDLKIEDDDGNENEMVEFANDENKDELDEDGKNVNSPSSKQRKKKSNKEKFKKERRDALKEYADLFDRLPVLEKQLLFYVLDLLATFDIHSAKNLMPARNLAAIFQPSILYHPDHDMSPDEYALSSLVIEFMIENSYKILPAAASTSTATQTTTELTASESSTTLSSRQSGSLNDPNSKLPPSTTYLQRKHSKSLSSVLTPPDMVRIQSKKKVGTLMTPRGSITGEEMNTDSAMEVDTEEDIDNLSSRRRSSSILVPTHQLQPQISRSHLSRHENDNVDEDDDDLILPPNPSFSPKKFNPHHIGNANSSSSSSLPITLNSSTQQQQLHQATDNVGGTSTSFDNSIDLDEQLRYLSDPHAQAQAQTTQVETDPRQSRSDEPRSISIPATTSSSNSKLLNLPSPKKSGNWFSRLRSRSRSRSNSKQPQLEAGSPPSLSPTGSSFPK